MARESFDSIDEVMERADDPQLRARSIARLLGHTWRQDTHGEWESSAEPSGSEADVQLDAKRRQQVRAFDVVHAAIKVLPKLVAPPKKRRRKKRPQLRRNGTVDVRALLEAELALTEPRGSVEQSFDQYVAYWEFVLRECIFRPMLEWAVLHARLEKEPQLARHVRQKPQHGARWDDELAALRSVVSAWEGQGKGTSATGRAIEKYRLGIVNLSGGGPMRDPLPDPWVTAAEGAYHATPDARLLYLTYVDCDVGRMTVERGRAGNRRQVVVEAGTKIYEELDEKVVSGSMPERSASTIARQVREGTGPLPFGSDLEASSGVSAALIVAENLGLLRGTHASKHDAIAEEVRLRTVQAKHTFRELLRAEHLDVKPSLLIPSKGWDPNPPTHAELDLRAARSSDRSRVECCAGFGEKIQDPARGGFTLGPCRSVDVLGPTQRHPSVAWSRCSRCDRPVVPKRNGAP